MSLLGYCKIVPSIVPVSSNTALTEVAIDCTGFDRVCHIIATGAMAASSKLDYKVVEDSAAAHNVDPSDISGAALTQVLAATGASKVYAIDVPVNPSKPYQLATAAAATDVVLVSAIAILYNGSGTYPKVAATQAIII